MQRMTDILARLRAMRLVRDTRGAAAVEFALILPFLLLLFLGSIEASSLITVDRRVNIISGTVGDLVARSEDSISASTLTDYFKASEGIIFPYAEDDLQQVVSLLQVASNGTTTVLWSCGYNGGTKHTINDPYTLPAHLNTIARPPSGSGYVVASETSYAYEPVLGLVLSDTFHLFRASFYLPRFESNIAGPTC